jgi:hypothetical protein
VRSELVFRYSARSHLLRCNLFVEQYQEILPDPAAARQLPDRYRAGTLAYLAARCWHRHCPRRGNRISLSPVYIGKRLLMKSLFPINCTTKATTKSNHIFHSALASGFLALAACSTLAPNTNNQAANYFDERPVATNQKTNNADPGYNWFY